MVQQELFEEDEDGRSYACRDLLCSGPVFRVGRAVCAQKGAYKVHFLDDMEPEEGIFQLHELPSKEGDVMGSGGSRSWEAPRGRLKRTGRWGVSAHGIWTMTHCQPNGTLSSFPSYSAFGCFPISACAQRRHILAHTASC